MMMMRLSLNFVCNAYVLAKYSMTSSLSRPKTPTPARSGGCKGLQTCRHSRTGRLDPRQNRAFCALTYLVVYSHNTKHIHTASHGAGGGATTRRDRLHDPGNGNGPTRASGTLHSQRPRGTSSDWPPSSTPVPFPNRPYHASHSLASISSPFEL